MKKDEEIKLVRKAINTISNKLINAVYDLPVQQQKILKRQHFHVAIILAEEEVFGSMKAQLAKVAEQCKK